MPLVVIQAGKAELAPQGFGRGFGAHSVLAQRTLERVEGGSRTEVEPEEREALQRQGAGATQGQMLREIAEALEAVSAERGMVLVLEDLKASQSVNSLHH